MSQFRGSAYFLAALIVAAFVGSLVWNPSPPPKFVGLKTSEVPIRLGNFEKIADGEMDEETRTQLKSATLFTRYYSEAGSGGQSSINLTIIGGTDRSALHDPRACLQGGGWELLNDHLVSLPGTDIGARMCRAVSNEQKITQAMMYVYVVDGNVVNDITRIRMEMAVSALLGRKNRPVYFVRFMQDIPAQDKDDKPVETRMAAFGSAVWKSLGNRLSGKGMETAKN